MMLSDKSGTAQTNNPPLDPQRVGVSSTCGGLVVLLADLWGNTMYAPSETSTTSAVSEVPVRVRVGPAEAKRQQLERRDFENKQRLLGYQLMKYREQCAQQEQMALRERKLKKALDDVRRRQEDEREAIAAHIRSKDNCLNRMMSHRKLQQQVNLESERLREQHRQAHRDRYHNRFTSWRPLTTCR